MCHLFLHCFVLCLPIFKKKKKWENVWQICIQISLFSQLFPQRSCGYRKSPRLTANAASKEQSPSPDAESPEDLVSSVLMESEHSNEMQTPSRPSLPKVAGTTSTSFWFQIPENDFILWLLWLMRQVVMRGNITFALPLPHWYFFYVCFPGRWNVT